MQHAVEAVDPFELPDWLGTVDITWTATTSVRGASRISGTLSSADQTIPCDLMAADLAYPEPLLPEGLRRQAHQDWTHGEVLLVSYDGRLTLAVPGTAYSADGVLETVGRLAKALGVRADRFTVAMRL
jgi:hypothetical protein